MTVKYHVLDTETTGVGSSDRIVEIAWVEINEDLEVLQEWCSLIDPEMPIPPGASGVHGITNKMIAASPTIEQFFEHVHPGPIPGPSVLIAHNVSFDKRFVAPWCEELVGTIDTLRLARLHFPDLENHKLQTLRYALELEGDAHRALGDVYTALGLLRVICTQNSVALPELVKMQSAPIRIQRMPFGKHRNMPMDAVDTGYLQWLSGLKDIDPDLLYTVNLILEERT